MNALWLIPTFLFALGLGGAIEFGRWRRWANAKIGRIVRARDELEYERAVLDLTETWLGWKHR